MLKRMSSSSLHLFCWPGQCDITGEWNAQVWLIVWIPAVWSQRAVLRSTQRRPSFVMLELLRSVRLDHPRAQEVFNAEVPRVFEYLQRFPVQCCFPCRHTPTLYSSAPARTPVSGVGSQAYSDPRCTEGRRWRRHPHSGTAACTTAWKTDPPRTSRPSARSRASVALETRQEKSAMIVSPAIQKKHIRLLILLILCPIYYSIYTIYTSIYYILYMLYIIIRAETVYVRRVFSV